MLSRNLKRAFSSYQNQLLINNKFVNSISGEQFATINPSNGKEICQVSRAATADVDLAVAAAKHAFTKGEWSTYSYEDRRALMNKIADHLEKNMAEIATIESTDNGKAFGMAMYDAIGSVKTLRYMAGWTDKIQGKTLPMVGPFMGHTSLVPVGVCGQITPFNFPLLMATFKIAPILATGCTGVLKPADQTPLSALKLGQYMVEAGMPEGVINILPGYADVGEAIVQHPDVSKIAFTGSSNVGKNIMRSAADSLKRVSLELGGKSPNIIFDDANFEAAVGSASFGCFLNSGQFCMAATRVFVQEGIYDRFVEASVQAAQNNIKMGDPFEEGVTHGPVISEQQMNKILNYIELGKKEGAKLVTGGNRINREGNFIEPTIFADVEDHMTIAREEIFGPVMSIMKFKTIDEVIQRANAHHYGLAGGVQTENIHKAMRVSNELQCGLAFVNHWGGPQSSTPFGGVKQSGFGRELGEKSLDEYLSHKSVIMKMD